MTDGTTGIQVAPISEDDMNKLQSIFQRALDAIVSMSKLAGEVETLRQQVGQLTDDAERLRRSNMALDESLSIARTQRLDLENKLREAEQAKATADKQASDYFAEASNTNSRLVSIQDELEQVRRSRDEAQYQVLELQDKLKASEAKVAAIHAALGIVPAPEPVPVPVEPNQTAAAMVDNPPPPTEVVPSAWPIENPRLRQYFDTWQPGSMWDDEKRQYYIES